MKKLNKNFEIKKVTVESMAGCTCTTCYCNSNCKTYSDWTGVSTRESSAMASASILQ